MRVARGDALRGIVGRRWRILRGAQSACLGDVANGIDARQRHIAARLIDVGGGMESAPLFDQPHAFPDEFGAPEVIGLADAPAQRVVLEAGGLGRVRGGGSRPVGLGAFAGPGLGHGADARGVHGAQPVFVVPLEALDGVFAAALFREPAVAVVVVAFVFEHAHEVVAHVAAGTAFGGRLVEQVAGRVVSEAFGLGVAVVALGTEQPADGVVVGAVQGTQ